MTIDVDTRPGPPNSTTDEKGIRFYTFGEGDTEERYISVTSVLRSVSKDGLIIWAARLSAAAAFDELPKLVKASRTKDCGNTSKRCDHDPRVSCVDCPCAECYTCVRRWVANRHFHESSRRADEGKRVHDVAEWWVLNEGDDMAHDEDIDLYIKQLEAFFADHGLTPDSFELAECTVINRAEGYAGTLDGIVVIQADTTPGAMKLVAQILRLPVSQVAGRSVRLVLDWKTREKPDPRLWPEHALQLAAYRNAAVVRIKGTDIEETLPDVDGAIVVQLRPDGYLCQPVVADELTYSAFLALLTFARWEHEYGKASVSPIPWRVPVEPGPIQVPPAKKTTARKAMPKKTATGRPIEDVSLPEAELIPVGRKSATLRSMTQSDWPSIPDDGIPF